MDPITTTANARAAQATTNSAVADAAEAGSTSLITSDFETFLNMLTAQLENQDPLDPLQATDFAVQLATFSSVEQQVLTNDRLAALSEQFALSGLSQLSSWIGMEARAAAPMAFVGQEIALDIAPTEPAAYSELIVTASDGTPVDRHAVPVAGGSFVWDGRRPDGGAFPADTYSFRIDSYNSDGELIAETVASAYGRVIEARLENRTPSLVLEGGTVLPTDAITAVRPASGEVTSVKVV